jgi:hypothetical protein
MIFGLLLSFLSILPASALTLYNSQDAKPESPNSKAAEQLISGFSSMFDALAAVERRSFGEAEEIKGVAVSRFQNSARLFLEAAREASDEKIIPKPRDEEDERTIQRMIQLSKQYELGEFSERRLFERLGQFIIPRFAEEFTRLRLSMFASKEIKDQRSANQFLLNAIRLQDLGRVVTAYLAIPRR